MQTRIKTEIKIEADCPEEPGAVKLFKLEKHTTRQVRRSDRESWLDDSAEPGWHVREVLINGFTRQQLAKLVADAADWLSYIEEG